MKKWKRLAPAARRRWWNRSSRGGRSLLEIIHPRLLAPVAPSICRGVCRQRALAVAVEPKGDTAHPAEQSVAGTGVARDAIASGLSAGMPIVIGSLTPPNLVEDAPRV